MEINKLITRIKQFGGVRLAREYVRIGVLWPSFKVGVRCIVRRQSFKQIYQEVLRRVEPYLVKKYTPLISISKAQVSCDSEHKKSKKVWFCWLQGMEQAPPIVKSCYNSLNRNLPDREIKVIDNSNWKEYVDLPDFIINKREKGRIPAALFSDMLRLELLIKYGGTWIDSTVLCTGFQDSCCKFQQYLDADLFLFQYTKQGSIPISISNWFITAYTNNEVLIVLRNMLYAYWKDYDCTLDYYIFHLFFSMLSKEYPKEIQAMPYGASQNSLVLLHHWDEVYDQQKWDKLTSNVAFHKLAFRVKEGVKENKDNYYHRIINIYR